MGTFCSSVLAVRRINDQLMQLERHFVDPQGLPNRAYFKWVTMFNISTKGWAVIQSAIV